MVFRVAMTRALWLLPLLAGLAGCQLVPEVARRPSVQNPFPQLSRVAVVEFANGTTDDTIVSGFDVAVAYASELQAIPGFEVVPPDIVKAQLADWRLTPADLNDTRKLRKLARELEVDAVVVGIITEYSPYYPPRLGLRTSWYAAQPCFHPIPPGYGLPWGTAAEEEIPDRLVYEAEFALAREQLRTQTPRDDSSEREQRELEAVPAAHDEPATPAGAARTPTMPRANDAFARGASPMNAHRPHGTMHVPPTALAEAASRDLPKNWPDPRGFVPPGPQAEPPPCLPSERPIMTHTRIYNGHDAQFTAALRNYHFFRDEARFGGWQGYLQRSEDFVRFCCHLHVAEMLTARGGAGKSRLVWRWPEDR